MLDELYGWIQNIAAYLVVSAAVLHAVPGKQYTKYIRFFSGLVLILLLISPVLRVAGIEESFLDLYHSREYEQETREMREASKRLEDADILDFVPEEYMGGTGGGETEGGVSGENREMQTETGAESRDENLIEVEEIRIGE